MDRSWFDIMIELSSVTIRIGDFQLKDLSFRIDAGQYAVVMGKTGIGKTTILEAICGLRAVHSGRILINGVDVERKAPTSGAGCAVGWIHAVAATAACACAGFS